MFVCLCVSLCVSVCLCVSLCVSVWLCLAVRLSQDPASALPPPEQHHQVDHRRHLWHVLIYRPIDQTAAYRSG